MAHGLQLGERQKAGSRLRGWHSIPGKKWWRANISSGMGRRGKETHLRSIYGRWGSLTSQTCKGRLSYMHSYLLILLTPSVTCRSSTSSAQTLQKMSGSLQPISYIRLQNNNKNIRLLLAVSVFHEEIRNLLIFPGRQRSRSSGYSTCPAISY